MGFATCGPNEAMVVSGVCLGNPALILGGQKYVWPFQIVQRLSLNLMTIMIDSQQVFSKKGVKVSVLGVAQVQVNSDDDGCIQRACRQFLGKRQAEICKIIQETMEGNQRAIIGIMTIEEIFRDKKAFSDRVWEVAKRDLFNMGLKIVSYTLKNVCDQDQYLLSIGMTDVADVQCQARIGQAIAKMESSLKGADAEERRVKAELENNIKIAEAEKNLKLNTATFQIEVNTKNAISSLAGQLQKAKTMQAIKKETMEVKVIERGQQIQVQEQEVLRRRKELDAKIRKPAEAEKYRIEKLAEANRAKKVLEAEAEAEAIKVRGEAESYAISVKAKAEAEQMKKKADAWGDFQEAAMVDMLLATLPKVAAEIAAPFSNVEKVKLICNGSKEIGVAKITQELLDIVVKMPSTMEKLTGVDITKALSK